MDYNINKLYIKLLFEIDYKTNTLNLMHSKFNNSLTCLFVSSLTTLKHTSGCPCRKELNPYLRVTNIV